MANETKQEASFVVFGDRGMAFSVADVEEQTILGHAKALAAAAYALQRVTNEWSNGRDREHEDGTEAQARVGLEFLAGMVQELLAVAPELARQ